MKEIKTLKRQIVEQLTGDDIEVDQRYPYTFCRIRFVWQGNEYFGRGFAKYNPNDKCIPGLEWDDEKGMTIAENRAIHDIAQQILLHANPQERIARIGEYLMQAFSILSKFTLGGKKDVPAI